MTIFVTRGKPLVTAQAQLQGNTWIEIAKTRAVIAQVKLK